MFMEFMGFLVAAGLFINQVNTVTLLIFMEFLLHNNLSSSNIVNYMAGIRSQFILYGLDTAPFRDERIHLFQKSLTITRPLCPKMSYIITTDILADILLVSASLEFPITFQALYAFCFFSFLRLSNLLPHSRASFDPTRQLCRGDLIVSSDSITVIIKRSKTIQNRRNTTTICVPALGKSPLCPFKAIRSMLDKTPGSPNDPLFQIFKSNTYVPLTDSVACKHLKKVATVLKVPSLLTFHLFRKSGTTCAFQHGVPLQQIMLHGTWTSDCIWRYVSTLPQHISPVAATFKQHLHT